MDGFRRVDWIRSRRLLGKGHKVAKKDLSPNAAIHFAYVILFVWIVSFTVDILVESYEPRPEVQGLMMAAATFLFGREVFGKKSQNGSNNKEDHGSDHRRS